MTLTTVVQIIYMASSLGFFAGTLLAMGRDQGWW